MEKGVIMYLLIEYKTDSTDYCSGCRMASYSSDHQVHNFLTAEQLVEKWAKYLHRNLNLDCNEAGYEFWIFKNGVMLFKENYTDWDGAERYGYNTDEYYEHIEELEAQEKADLQEISELHHKAKAMAQVMQDKQKQNEKKLTEQKAAEDRTRAKEDRRKEFEKLQQEFGS
jgi:hypothetical protein